MAIPTFEQYKASNPGATWAEYVSRFSAMAAERQAAAGEIPSDYTGYSFTEAGVWVESGSPAAIGGLPAEIKSIFPGVEQTYQQAYQQAVEGSVITTSRVTEPQTSFGDLATNPSEVPVTNPSGGSSPVEFSDVGTGQQTGIGAPIGTVGSTYFAGNGNGNGEGSGVGILVLLALLGLGGF